PVVNPLPVENVPAVLGQVDFLFEDELQGGGHVLAVLAPARLVPGGHEGQGGQTGDGHVAFVKDRAEGTVGVLVGRQVSQALVDGLIRRRGDHPLGGAAVGHVLPGEGQEGGTAGCQPDKRSAAREELTAGPHGSISFFGTVLFGDGPVVLLQERVVLG